MLGVSALLLNTLFIVLAMFVYELIVGRRTIVPLKVNRVVISILTSAAAILCITFPVAQMTSDMYDLRSIPLLISFFYGGLVPGVIVLASILIYDFLHGGGGFYIAVVTLVIQAVAACLMSKRFRVSRLAVKLLIGSALVIAQAILQFVICLWIQHEIKGETSFYITFMVTSGATMILMIWLIEYMKQNHNVRAALAQSEKFRVVSELAAAIAHEVRNPMTAVRGFTQLLSKDTPIRERFSSELDIMLTELDRAHQIISDYLSFARPSEDNIEVIDIVKHTSHVVAILAPLAHANSTIIQESYQGTPHVIGNAGKLEQALVNIVKNAIESISHNGAVDIFVGKSGGYVNIQISDTGCGMTEAEASRLGTPFYSTKASGTGLGLTSTYQIIRLMNGTIGVKSKRNVGTTFTILLPFAELT